MPGYGKMRRKNARKRSYRQQRAQRGQRAPMLQRAMGAATAVPRAGLDIVTDAAQRTKQLLTPKG